MQSETVTGEEHSRTETQEDGEMEEEDEEEELEQVDDEGLDADEGHDLQVTFFFPYSLVRFCNPVIRAW